MKILEYLVVLLVVAFMRVIPLSAARSIGAGLADLAYRVLAKPRRVGGRNLHRSFPDWTPVQVDRTLREVYRRMGYALGEVCRLQDFDLRWMERNVSFQDRSAVDAIQGRGRGVIALVCHFSNWELQGALFARWGYRPKVVAFPQSNPHVDRLIRLNRESTGMKIVYTGHKGTIEVLRHLREGGMVGILADQNAGAGGLRLPFFGRDCSVAKAPAVLARKSGAAILPIFLTRGEKHHFTVHVLPEVEVSKTDDAEMDVLETTRRWLAVQEEFIRKRPEEYFWLHSRWKHYEASERSASGVTGVAHER
jgi:Kdo2-lipid IVA lauroyltransferase/acyltransferase